MEFSSAFNTIIPTLLQTTLTQLSVPSSICQWITSFLTASETGEIHVKQPLHQHWCPQGCVLSPLLFSLYTNDCTSKDPSVKLLKFADDTTLIGLIQDGDESAYRQEVKELAVWCSLNNLDLPFLSKILEKVVSSQLYSFLEKSDISEDFQPGFRLGMSIFNNFHNRSSLKLTIN